MAKRIRLALSGLVLGLFFMAFFMLLTGAFTWHDFRKIEQKQFHGQILNRTNKPVHFVHTEGVTLLPAWGNSMDTGVLDADGIVIDHPVWINQKLYTQGVFVVCDFGKLTLRSTPHGDVLESSPGSWTCRLLSDYGFKPKLRGYTEYVKVHLWKK